MSPYADQQLVSRMAVDKRYSRGLPEFPGWKFGKSADELGRKPSWKPPEFGFYNTDIRFISENFGSIVTARLRQYGCISPKSQVGLFFKSGILFRISMRFQDDGCPSHSTWLKYFAISSKDISHRENVAGLYSNEAMDTFYEKGNEVEVVGASTLHQTLVDIVQAKYSYLMPAPVWIEWVRYSSAVHEDTIDWKILDRLWKVIAAQIAFWFLLVYFYPKSPHVQAFFFWNRWARKFLGFGYVDFLLTWIPALRGRLLAPFGEELAADARTADDSLKEYFDNVQVEESETAPPRRLGEAIAEVAGQIVLEGESGPGKSMFLRRLVKDVSVPMAYLPADSCDRGVFEALQLRLKGKASDESFLKSIIWFGGLRVVIDGLNEVTVETREKIRRFLDDFPKAHVLLATQPLLWKRPPKARSLRLLKLSDDRILSFLESRYPSLHGASMSESDYKSKCATYLKDVLSEGNSQEDRDAARLVLSNPMDLATVARILASGERPTLTNLQEQQFQRMKRDFEDIRPGVKFPLQQFSESIYKRRLCDELTLDSDQFFEAIQVMIAHKMVLEHNNVDAAGKPTRKWVFRHDKIGDYFLMQAVLSQQEERIPKHIDDPRFRGVYLMLASQLPLEQARDLRDLLVDRAAETKDHYLSDPVVRLLRTRKVG